MFKKNLSFIVVAKTAIVIMLGALALTLGACDPEPEPESEKAAAPVAYPPGGSYSSTQNVILVSATDGAVIYYTTNGNTPTTSSAIFTDSITISVSTPLKAIAVHGDMANSDVMSAMYTLPFTEQAAAPTANPLGGTYSGSQLVTLASQTEGAAIYYTTDGSTPSVNSTLYSGTISISTSTTLRAVAIKNGVADSTVMTAIYNITNPDLGPLTEVKWQEILMGIETDSTFNGALDLSYYSRSDSATGGGLRSSGIFDPGSAISIGKSKITSIILPSTTTGIAGGTSASPTFRYFTGLESFSGAMLSTIGDYAFSGCTKLAMNTLPAYLTSIGNGAFQGCTSLTELTLPAGLSSIGDNVFQGCTGLTEVTSLGTTPPALGLNAFDSIRPTLAIRVPADNVEAYRAASGWSAYAGIILAIGVTPVISIDTQPEATTNVILENISESLALTASVTEGVSLWYQWYSSATDSNANGTAISGATSASFAIPVDLTAGSYYYFCEIMAAAAVSVRSAVARVNAVTPGITIDSQPVAATNVAQGSISGSLSVAASINPAGPLLGYQWYSNTSNSNAGGTVISGATETSYTIPTNLAEGTYYYFCEISAAGAASVRSNVAVVNSVIPVISINTQPVTEISVTHGSISGSLSVAASVSPAGPLISYQWYSNTVNSNVGGTIFNGATDANFTIPTNLVVGSYYYFCEVSATGAVSVRSNVTAVNVTTAPVITINTQPAATTNVTFGSISGSLTVSASVTLGAALSYQWYSNTTNSNVGGTLISGATGTSYTIPTDLTAGTNYYFCEVSAFEATPVHSAVATVNVITPVITIGTQPAATTNVAQGSISGNLSVAASVSPSGPPLSYQWYSNTTNSNVGGTAISGATGTSYTIPATLTAGNYYYFCEVSATGATSVRSNVAIVNVVTPAITINTQPAATTNVVYGSISGSLSMVASVSPAGPVLGYQWYSNTTNSNVGGTLISGATGASYTIPTNLTAGSYYYFCEVSAIGAESVRSNVAIINVYNITIDTQPAATTYNIAQKSISGSLSVAASVSPSGPSLSYQWYSNTTNSNTGGNIISGATGTNYTIPTSLAVGTYYYFCEVSATGVISVRSNVAEIKVINLVIEMIQINPGTFQMGSPESEIGRFDAETQHSVTLSSGFYIGKYQVTQEQYQAVTGSNPSSYSSNPQSGEVQSKRPVESVSWYDALVFCNKLSMAEGLSPAYSISGSTNPADWGAVPESNNSTWNSTTIVQGSTGYRLPTEAQWEYACRAGTTTAFNDGTTDDWNQTTAVNALGWYLSNNSYGPHEVGKKTPNNWGLYDMHGNVWEWCWDWYGDYASGAQSDPTGAVAGSNRVGRGGHWNYTAHYARSAYRGSLTLYYRGSSIGFRLACP